MGLQLTSTLPGYNRFSQRRNHVIQRFSLAGEIYMRGPGHTYGVPLSYPRWQKKPPKNYICKMFKSICYYISPTRGHALIMTV